MASNLLPSMRIILTEKYAMLQACVFCIAVSLSVSAPCESPTNDQKTADRVRELLLVINDHPDPLHGQDTPAVSSLVKIGLPSLRHGTLELLLSEDEGCRLRAHAVLEGVVSRMFGFIPGQGWVSDEQEKEFNSLWTRSGDYYWNNSRSDRECAYQLWKEWIEKMSR